MKFANGMGAMPLLKAAPYGSERQRRLGLDPSHSPPIRLKYTNRSHHENTRSTLPVLYEPLQHPISFSNNADHQRFAATSPYSGAPLL